MPVLLRPVNNFLGQVIGNASEGKYNTVNNSTSREVNFQKCLNSRITLFSSKNSNKSQTFATGAYQRLHEARPRRVVWLREPEYGDTSSKAQKPNRNQLNVENRSKLKSSTGRRISEELGKAGSKRKVFSIF